MNTRPVRTAAVLTSAALALALTGCGADAPSTAGAREDASPAARPQSPDPGPENEPTSEPDPKPVRGQAHPLEEPVEVGADRPVWGLSYVSGWSTPTEAGAGIYQITKDGTDAVVTAYQLSGGEGSSDDRVGRQWLVDYYQDVSEAAAEVSDPRYETMVVKSTKGDLEFIALKFSYRTPDGVVYRSQHLARGIGGNLLAVEYAAPKDEWRQADWEKLSSAGLTIAL